MEKGAYTVDSGMPGGDPVISGGGSAVPNGGFANGGFANEGFANGGFVAPSAGLVVPTGGSTVSENGDIILNPNTKKNKKIWIVIGCVVIILLLVGIVFGIWAIMDNNRKSRKNEAEELSSLLNWVESEDQCMPVARNASNVNTTRNEFEKYLQDCKSRTERTMELLAKLQGYSEKDEYKTIYESINKFVSERVVFGSELEEKLNDYRTWHEFILNAEEMDYYVYTDEVEELIKPVVEIGNDELSAYVTSWARKRSALNNAYVLMDVSFNEQTSSEFYARKADFEAFANNGIDVNSAIGFNNNSDNKDFKSALFEYRTFVSEEQ